MRDGDIARSTRMLELLSTMLRRVLDGSLPQIVSLETEIALLRQYLEIEEVRFTSGWERRRVEHTGLSATTLRITTLYGSNGSLDIRAGADGGTISTVVIPYVQVAEDRDEAAAAAADVITLQPV